GYRRNRSGQPRAFPWSDSATGIIDLNMLIDPLSGWQLTEGRAINDLGQITGTGVFNGQTRGFLLTPVPEPGTWALLLGGLGLVGWTARRRRRISADRSDEAFRTSSVG